jgi:hypothetical protein
MHTVDHYLTELEELSARALELADAGDTVAAAVVVNHRGEAVQRLQALSEPLSYTDWNRLVVIHYQGNQIAASLATARKQIASEFLESAREHAFLECIGGVINSEAASPAHVNEHA